VVKRFEERREFGPGWRHGPLRSRLNLDENQIEAIETMHEKIRSKMLPLRQALDKKRMELIHLLRAESKPDKARLDTLSKEIANLQAEIELCIFENIRQATETLTPEQKQQFFELLQRRLPEMNEFPPPGPGMQGFPPGRGYERGPKIKPRRR